MDISYKFAIFIVRNKATEFSTSWSDAFHLYYGGVYSSLGLTNLRYDDTDEPLHRSRPLNPNGSPLAVRLWPQWGWNLVYNP